MFMLRDNIMLLSLVVVFFIMFSPIILYFFFFFLIIRPPPSSPLFPYPTLFRSSCDRRSQRQRVRLGRKHPRAFFAHRPQRFNYRSQLRGQHLREFERRWNGEAVEFERRLTNSDRKSTRLNSSHLVISYAVFCLK